MAKSAHKNTPFRAVFHTFSVLLCVYSLLVTHINLNLWVYLLCCCWGGSSQGRHLCWWGSLAFPLSVSTCEERLQSDVVTCSQNWFEPAERGCQQAGYPLRFSKKKYWSNTAKHISGGSEPGCERRCLSWFVIFMKTKDSRGEKAKLVLFSALKLLKQLLSRQQGWLNSTNTRKPSALPTLNRAKLVCAGLVKPMALWKDGIHQRLTTSSLWVF